MRDVRTKNRPCDRMTGLDDSPIFRAAWRHVGAGVLSHQRCGCYSEAFLANRRWYCVATHPGQDFLANATLRAAGYLTYLPLFVDRSARHAEPIIDPLFPGYQFIAADRATQPLGEACYARGVKAFVSANPLDPRPVRNGLVEALIARAGDDGLIDDHKPPARLEAIPSGAAVTILTGPLSGSVGVCSMTAGDRVRVFLGLLGGASVTVTRASVALAPAAA